LLERKEIWGKSEVLENLEKFVEKLWEILGDSWENLQAAKTSRGNRANRTKLQLELFPKIPSPPKLLTGMKCVLNESLINHSKLNFVILPSLSFFMESATD
jgi:hypothetical protein